MNLKVKAKETVKGVDYSITAGKIYPAKHSDGYHYEILDDFGRVKYFYKTRFELLDDTFPEFTKNPNSTSLAQYITSKLFELGNEGDKLTNRISFMVGTYGVDEEAAGGMNKLALEKFFERVITNFKEEL